MLNTVKWVLVWFKGIDMVGFSKNIFELPISSLKWLCYIFQCATYSDYSCFKCPGSTQPLMFLPLISPKTYGHLQEYSQPAQNLRHLLRRLACRHRLLCLDKDWERQIRGRQQPTHTEPTEQSERGHFATWAWTPTKTNTMTAMLAKKGRQQ